MKRFLAFLLLFVLASCARPPAPVLETFPGLENELVKRAQARGASFENIKGLAEIKLKMNGRSNSFTSAIVLQKPDRMRIDILSPFGATYVRAASDGDTLRLYLVNDGRFFSGLPVPQNLARITRFPIDLRQMVDVMLYSLTLAGVDVGEVSIRDGRYSVTIRDGELAQELLFDAERNLRSSRMFRSGVALWSADYSSFEGRAAFPHQIEILNPDKDMFLKIHFESVNLNSTLDPSVFVIKPPDSVAVEPFPPLEPGSIN